MPRANIASTADWRAELQVEHLYRDQAMERLIQRWSLFVMICTLLYMFIGPHPFSHEVEVDEAGAIAISPINRYVWLSLAAMSAPILWGRREMLPKIALKLWPVILLFVWFAMTTTWALDPATSSRRLFLYIIALIISVALAVGFNSSRRMHEAFCIACAIMIGIDMATWMASPGGSMTEIGLAAIHNHKNTLGSVMMICGIMIAPHIFAQRTFRMRFFWSVTLLFGMALLVASRSKTSQAILLAVYALIPFLLVLLRMRLQVVYAFLSAGLVILLGSLLVWLGWCVDMGLDTLAPVNSLTFTQRTDVWSFVLGEIFKRPITGQGFASFWDINPALQPSLQTDLWFVQPGNFTNEAHNGYLDLLATTGLVGLAGALFVMTRWVVRGLIGIRKALWSADADRRRSVPYAVALGVFPMIVFAHNFMESSYFTANSTLGTLILMIGVALDLRYGEEADARLRSAPMSKMAMMRNSRA